MNRTAALGLLLLLAACDVRSRPQQRWIGQVAPTTSTAGCSESRGVLLMRENDVVFAPDEGTWILYGTASPGKLQAAASRIGADKKPYDTTLDATWSAAEVTGTYTTPRCTYKVVLKRQ